MTEVPHRQGKEEGAGNSGGERMAGWAWVILQGRWFITVAKSKDPGVTQFRFQSRLNHIPLLCAQKSGWHKAATYKWILVKPMAVKEDDKEMEYTGLLQGLSWITHARHSAHSKHPINLSCCY